MSMFIRTIKSVNSKKDYIINIKVCNLYQFCRRYLCSRNGIEKKKTYLEQWLGNDMQGERYLEIVERNILSKSKRIQDPRERTSNYNILDHHIPSISFDWREPVEKILQNIRVKGRLNGNGFLDMKFTQESLQSDQINDIILNLKLSGFNTIAAINVPTDLRATIQSAGLPVVDLSPNTTSNGTSAKVAHSLTAKSLAAAAEGPVLAAAVAQVAPIPVPGTAVATATPSASALNIGPKSALVHFGTVRSGQHIYAQGRSLVVVGSVHRGGEVLADGDVHVYGRLMGRAVAGIKGEEQACVYATHFDPSLVGVGDSFLLPGDCEAMALLLGKALSVARAPEGKQARDGCLWVRGDQAGEKEQFVVTILS